MFNLKIWIPFCQKKISLKSFYLVIICNLSHFKREDKVKIYVKNIIGKIYVGPKPTEKSHPDPKKTFRIHSTAIFCVN